MDSAGTNYTVSLMRCDDILQTPPRVVDSVDTVRVDPNHTGVSCRTTEVKRSARLSRKRTLQDVAAAVETTGRSDGANAEDKTPKTPKSNVTKTETETRATLDSDEAIKANSRDSAAISSTPGELSCVSRKDADELPRSYRLRSKHDERDVLVRSTRKRGRPPQRQPRLLYSRDADKVGAPRDAEVGGQNTRKGLPRPVEKPQSTDRNFDAPSKPKRKRTVPAADSCRSSDAADEPVKADEPAATSENDEADVVVSAANGSQRSRVETFDREIDLVSNRFNVPCDALRKMIENDSVSVLREMYSDSVTLPMVTVSPIVSMAHAGQRESARTPNGTSVRYSIEPNRKSVAYEKTNLKDTMDEISKTMPSWSLSVVADPPRYVISHMSIETYGTPIANKCVVLDRHFRASVYINQRLEYKYCKRYTTASEIVDLVKELDAIRVRCPFL